jgi:hypothetical protein
MNNTQKNIDALIIQKGNFEEAEDYDVTYYAGISWLQSVSIVEELRRTIWSKEYENENKKEKLIRKANLKDDRDEFEC